MDTVSVPREPTEAMWSGLARQIVFWNRGGDRSGSTLYRDLALIGMEAPDWLRKEIPDVNHVPPKGTVAVCIYKAMIAAAPVSTAPVVGEDAQTIDSAPKDKAILVYSSGWEKAHYNTSYKKWIGHGYDTSDTNLLNLHPPTHWRSLPPDPKAAFASIPTPTAGRAEALEEAAKICDNLHTHYLGMWKSNRLNRKGDMADAASVCALTIRRALSSAPTQAVTVDDAKQVILNAVKPLLDEFAKPQFMTQSSGGGKASVEFTFVGEDRLKRAHDLHDAFISIAKTINDAAVFPQRREE